MMFSFIGLTEARQPDFLKAMDMTFQHLSLDLRLLTGH